MDGQEAATNLQDVSIANEDIRRNLDQYRDNAMAVVAANNIDSEGVVLVGKFPRTRCRPGPAHPTPANSLPTLSHI